MILNKISKIDNLVAISNPTKGEHRLHYLFIFVKISDRCSDVFDVE